MKGRRTIFALLLTGLSLMLSGCDMDVLNPKGIIATDEKWILVTAVLLMLVIVVPVIIMTLVMAWRYRASNAKARYRPEWSHSVVVEIFCWSIPCVIILILSIITWITSHTLDPYRPLEDKMKPLSIQAISLDWKWLFIYPDQHIATVNFVELPVGVPVRFSITSDAPMNSFLIPQLAGQIYAMAGMKTTLYIKASEVGDYRGFSANYTGNGFSGMNFVARVATPENFENWVQEVKQSPQSLTFDVYNELAKQSENNPVQYYSSVADNLFDEVMMKFMMPMPGGMGSMTTTSTGE